MNQIARISQNPSNRILVDCEDVPVYLDFNRIQEAREHEARQDAWLNNLFAEDNKKKNRASSKALRAVKRMGNTHRGRRYFGWFDTPHFIVALHTVPVLWGIDMLRRNDEASRKLDAALRLEGHDARTCLVRTMKAIYCRPWSQDFTYTMPGGWFEKHPAAAVGVAAISLLVSSPMMIFSIPAVAVAGLRKRIARWFSR